MDSPIIVDRKWPTCICFAMFGDEKSTKTRFLGTDGGLTPFRNMLLKASAANSLQKKDSF